MSNWDHVGERCSSCLTDKIRSMNTSIDDGGLVRLPAPGVDRCEGTQSRRSGRIVSHPRPLGRDAALRHASAQSRPAVAHSL